MSENTGTPFEKAEEGGDPSATPGASAGGEKEPRIQREDNLDLLLDTPLEITIELGRTKMLINDLLKLGQGAVIELPKESGETLEIHSGFVLNDSADPALLALNQFLGFGI